MDFVLQDDNKCLNEEVRDIRDILSSSYMKYTHTYQDISLDNLNNFDNDRKKYIPVGTIPFIRKFFGDKDDSMFMRPIEVPKFLRKKPFILRECNFVRYEDLPKTGRYFFKTASLLKGIIGEVVFADRFEDYIEGNSKQIDESGVGRKTLWTPDDVIFQVSEPVKIYSEYRVLVNNFNAVTVQLYKGDPLIFPDATLIKSAINEISKHRSKGALLPESYTLDFMVSNYGTELVEMHNFISCGTYGYKHEDLVYMYRDGVEFELKCRDIPFDISYYL